MSATSTGEDSMFTRRYIMAENGWEVWSKFVLKELDRLGTGIEKLDTKNTGQHKEIFDTLNAVKESVSLVRIKVAGISAIVGIVIAVISNIVITAVKGG